MTLISKLRRGKYRVETWKTCEIPERVAVYVLSLEKDRAQLWDNNKLTMIMTMLMA